MFEDKQELSRQKIQYLNQSFEHYRQITRSVSIDYYKTVMLANAAGLIALATIMLTVKNLMNAQRPPKFEVDSIRFWAGSLIFVSAISIGSSFFGYIITYLNALSAKNSISEQIEKSLFGSGEIDKPHFKTFPHSEFAFKVIGSISGFSFLLAVCIELRLVSFLW